MIAPAVLDKPKLPKSVVGRVGENLAAYYLESIGFECSIVDRRGADIWCRAPNKQLFGLEVKSAYAQPSNGGLYAFTFSKKEADQYMLTCLDTNIVRIFSRERLLERMKSNTMHFKAHEFDLEMMYEDIERLKRFYS